MGRLSLKPRLILLLALTVWISGCVTLPSKPDTLLVPTYTRAFVTETPMRATSTLSSTATPQVIVTSSPTSLSTASPTAPATLTPDQAQVLVSSLLEDNAGCRLPCWWGFTPGQTAWQQAWSFLAQFDSGIEVVRVTEQLAFAEVFIPTQPGVYPMHQRYTIQHDLITTISISDIGEISTYQLSRLLANYGQPEEIWLSTYATYPGERPFVIVLLYSEQGILATYNASEQGAEMHEGLIHGCLRASAGLRLWAPTVKLSFREAAGLFNWEIDDAPYLPLADTTDMTVEEFYQFFREPTTIPCLDTPTQLWPDAY